MNGVQKGNIFMKVFVVRQYYGVDAIAGGKLYTQLSNTNEDDSFMVCISWFSIKIYKQKTWKEYHR